MIRVIPAYDMYPFRFPDLHKILPGQFDRTLVRLRSRGEEDRMRKTTWAMTDQHLTESFR